MTDSVLFPERISKAVFRLAEMSDLGPKFGLPNSLLPIAVPRPTIKKNSAKGSDASWESGGFPLTVNDSKGNGVWVLVADVESMSSFQAGCDKKPSIDECRIIDSCMIADGYQCVSSTSASTIWRADCKFGDCAVQLKFQRGNQRIAKYQRGSHTHLPPSDGTSASVRTSNSGKASPRYISVGQFHGQSSLSHRLPSVPTSTAAAGCSKSPNANVAKALLRYANGLKAYNDASSTSITRLARNEGNGVSSAAEAAQQEQVRVEFLT
jgi:hypothetical protein